MTAALASPPTRQAGSRTLGRAALGVCTLGALLAAASSLAGLGGASDDAVLAEAWRGWGYLMFAGFFVLLALRPVPGPVWVLVILHKAAMSATAAVLVLTDSEASGTITVAVADGAVTLLLIGAYLLLRRSRTPQHSRT